MLIVKCYSIDRDEPCMWHAGEATNAFRV